MKPLRRFVRRMGGFLNRGQHEQRLQEEFAEHIEYMTEANIAAGMSPAEARRQAVLKFGPVEATKDAYRDQGRLPRLDALATDVVFGWRQLRKSPTVSVAAVLSLGLAIGATTAAFRLVDAVLLRTLPVADPERLYFVGTKSLDRAGKPDYRDDFDYPMFRRYSEILAGKATSLVVGSVARPEVQFKDSAEPERLYRQFVSGNFFATLGLQPSLGRLLSANDDVAPGGHPIAVISHDYWQQRFHGEATVIGRSFRLGRDWIEIVGVGPKGFTGTEPGEVTDVFVPATMNAEALDKPGWSWFRMWVRPVPGVEPEQIRQPLQAALIADRKDSLKNFHSDTPKHVLDAHLDVKILMLPAGSGASRLQKQYRSSLIVLSVLVGLVLLVACVNVANLLTAQGTARAREMALRISIGAGRWRLIQLLLVQAGVLAAGATVLGAVFASWAAPFVTSMLRVPGDPVRLVLTTGWREIAFSALLAAVVMMLFGLMPAVRTSAVQPALALKGNAGGDPHARRRLMNALLSTQFAFCVLVLFIAGLFIHTFQRLANRPLGFQPDFVLAMDVDAGKMRTRAEWAEVTDQLRAVPGVQYASFVSWPLLSANRWTATMRVPGGTADLKPPCLLEVSPGFFDTMQIGMISGRDFRPGDVQPDTGVDAGVGIVNETFARTYFGGADPVGRTVLMRRSKDVEAPMTIIGYVRDSAYYNLREPIPSGVFLPIVNRAYGTMMVRTAGDPRAFFSTLRQEVMRVRSDYRVRLIQPQNEFIRWHLIRERLLGSLSMFFAMVALALAGIGLYGVLNYSVTRQQREIGIRMALGAGAPQVLRSVTNDILLMICIGSVAGIAGGLASARLIESLLFEVRATDVEIIAGPVVTLIVAAVLAGLPPAIRAVRTDPALTLRAD